MGVCVCDLLRPQVVDRGTTTRYGGQLQYKRVSSPDKQAAANHAAVESPERGGGEWVAPLIVIKYPHVLYVDSATWRV